MTKKIKQLFCKHSFEKYYVMHGFRVVDGWIERVYDYRCPKCGKQMIAKGGLK